MTKEIIRFALDRLVRLVLTGAVVLALFLTLAGMINRSQADGSCFDRIGPCAAVTRDRH